MISTLPNICRRPAMNTLFEIIVGGDDLENDLAAAEVALDEIERIESVLSRFDPASEVARLNREAHQRPVLVSYELLEILEACRDYREKTFGFFDIAAASETGLNFESVEIDSNTRRVSFANSGVKLDFGAFGKGYALDCAAQLLKEHGVLNAVLHGGTSSVLAFGNPVRVGLRNPWNETEEIDSVILENQGLSSSAVYHRDQKISDIINPHDQTRLHDEAACVVIGSTAAEAEVHSTALLCMGKELAAKFCAENFPPPAQVFWINKELFEAQKVGRVTPCAPSRVLQQTGAHGVTRPIIQRIA